MQGAILNPLNLHIVELFLMTGLLLKIIATYFIKLKKFKKHPNFCFWFYLFFAISYVQFSIIACLQILLEPSLSKYLYPQTLNFFKNLFFSGALVYFQIFCYKVLTNNPLFLGDVDVPTKKRKLTTALNIVYYLSIGVVLIQSVMLGLIPQMFWNTLWQPEFFTTGCAVLSLVLLLWLGVLFPEGIPKRMFWYKLCLLLTSLILPLSYIINFINTFANLLFEENAVVYAAAIRAPFLICRIFQLLLLGVNLFNVKDVELLYD